MSEKIKECKNIIIEKIYQVLNSGKEINAETFVGLSQIIVELDKNENKEIRKENEVI